MSAALGFAELRGRDRRHRVSEGFHAARAGSLARGSARNAACPGDRPEEALPFLPARLGPYSPPLEKGIARGPVAAFGVAAAGTRFFSEALKASPIAPAVPEAAAGRGSAPTGGLGAASEITQKTPGTSRSLSASQGI